ncbi:MAG: hypothetical protein R3F39_18350 [Myxococcota bacterium]
MLLHRSVSTHIYGVPAVLACTLALLGGSALAVEAAPDLSGTWARLEVTSEVSQVPMVGEVTTTHRAIALLKIAQEGSKLTLTERLCGVRLESDKDAAQVALSDGFVPGAPEVIRHARLRKRGNSWRFRADELVEVHGAELAKPATDPLPTDAHDARVRDIDRDGHPGMTIEIRGMVEGSIRLAQRLRTTARGLVRSLNRIDGLVSWSRDQSILEATNLFLRTSPPSAPHKDRARSWFRTERVAGDADCAAVLRDAERLFKR